MKKVIPFTEWSPDVGPVHNDGLFTLTNGIPSPGGYEPVATLASAHPAQAATSQTLSAPGYSISLGGSTERYFFQGTSTQIYRYNASATAVNVSGTTAYGGGNWSFVQWGEDILATNFEDDIQTMPSSGTSFVVLSSATATPKAKCIASARNFVIVGFTNDATDGTSPYRVQWSALGDSTDWVVSPVTQSDFEDLIQTGGAVQCIVGGEYAVVFQETAITRMTYVGPPTIWQFDQVQSELGLFAPYAVAKRGDMIFFLAEDGFYMLMNGSEIRPIGHNKINKWFFSKVANTYALRQLITCAADPSNKRVYWVFPNAPDGSTYSIVIYDWGLDKWGTANSLDYVVSEYLSYVNTPTIALSRINSDSLTIGIPDGSATSTISCRTGRMQLTPGRNSLVRSIEILGNSEQPDIPSQIDGGAGRSVVSLYGYESARSAATDGVALKSTTSETTMRTTGRINVRGNAKYHAVDVALVVPRNSKEDVMEIGGFEIDYVPSHSR